MSEISLENRLKVHELIARYSHLVDGGDSRGWSELFLEDAVFGGIAEPMVGRQAFYDRCEGLKAGETEYRHAITNVFLHEGSTDERAKASAYGVVTDWAKTPPMPSMFCIYHYDLVNCDGTWMIAGIEGDFPYQ